MDLFRQDRLAGTLLGVAVNDVSGVATAQSGLMAAALGASRLQVEPSEQVEQVEQRERVVAAFRGALVGWSLRHPWTADADTLHACGCIALGFRRSGTLSPTSGAAVRAAIVGAAIPYDVDVRLALGTSLAEVTHADARSIDAALFAAEVAAACVQAPANVDRVSVIDRARWVVRSPELVVALHYALELVDKKVTMELAARELGTGNAAIEALPLAAFAFARFGDALDVAMQQFESAAGPRHVNGVNARASRAILGGWIGTLTGGASLPWSKVARLREGAFGAARLHALASSLVEITSTSSPRPIDEGSSVSRILPNGSGAQATQASPRRRPALKAIR